MRALTAALARVRAGTARPAAAIVLPPVLVRGWPEPSRWATFPWPAVGAYADAVASMSYRTSYIPASRCASGDQQYCAYQYTRDNVLLSRQLTGLPVHVIGGAGDPATLAQVSGYVARHGRVPRRAAASMTTGPPSPSSGRTWTS